MEEHQEAGDAAAANPSTDSRRPRATMFSGAKFARPTLLSGGNAKPKTADAGMMHEDLEMCDDGTANPSADSRRPRATIFSGVKLARPTLFSGGKDRPRASMFSGNNFTRPRATIFSGGNFVRTRASIFSGGHLDSCPSSLHEKFRSSHLYNDKSNIEIDYDKAMLQYILNDIGAHAFGIIAVEVWEKDGDGLTLSMVPGGFWVDPVFAKSHSDNAALVELISKDYSDVDPVFPGGGLAGYLWTKVGGASSENLNQGIKYTSLMDALSYLSGHASTSPTNTYRWHAIRLG